jgi:hypothetical protein
MDRSLITDSGQESNGQIFTKISILKKRSIQHFFSRISIGQMRPKNQQKKLRQNENFVKILSRVQSLKNCILFQHLAEIGDKSMGQIKS